MTTIPNENYFSMYAESNGHTFTLLISFEKFISYDTFQLIRMIVLMFEVKPIIATIELQQLQLLHRIGGVALAFQHIA